MSEKIHSRREIQDALEPAIHLRAQELGFRVGFHDIAHTRRTLRALFRIAARIAGPLGCDLRTFVVLAAECFESERSSTRKATA